MKKKSVLIVEDEFSIAFDVETRLKKMGYDVAGIALNYTEAIVLLAEKDYDIVLLDINLEDKKSGIDLGILIHEKFHRPIIFITAYSDEKTFSDAIKANPMGYLIKPINDNELNRNIIIALQNFQKFNNEKYGENNFEKRLDQLFIKEKGIIKQIKCDEIQWVEAMENYSIIYTLSEKFIVNSFLKEVIEKLDNRLIRIHRSHAVALDKISHLDGNAVYLGKTFLPISPKYKNDLIDRMNLL